MWAPASEPKSVLLWAHKKAPLSGLALAPTSELESARRSVLLWEKTYHCLRSR
jgi:hypothetical protein